ncbi:C40 family peptidase [Neisseria montereyensis]|uniref:C40 family peptidase n=1 Tax=Neisseria montereyensis TaxID=2973938 RepID=A0ABT2FDZ7_9NEIS|nr:C40 family peptidase [Neisseria montereyensis]MCS4534432.1 C40 family peptidase [Neisseria montereyensis]
MNNFKQLCSTALATVCLMLADIQLAHADEIESLLRLQAQDGFVSAVGHQYNESQNIGGSDADNLISSAMGLLGVAYRYGGNSVRTGFDCSGFMQHIFKNSMQINLPRTSAQQAKMGVHVNRSDLQPGDMVFFRTMGKGRISHVGLYIGNNRFIHAPRTGKNIEITSLNNKYWNSKYAFGRRVTKNDPSRFLN